MFDEFMRGFGLLLMRRRLLDLEPSWRTQSSFDASTPAIDVVEKEKEYRITAQLPGLDKRDVEISVAADVLTVRARRRRRGKRRTTITASPSAATVRFSVASSCQPTSIPTRSRRSSKKGVLTLTPPKAPQAPQKMKKIAIKAK